MSSSNFGSLFDNGSPSNYWQGVVAPRQSWERDQEIVNGPSELKNWGYRVKCRIQGVHPPDKNELSDEQLPWISINCGSTGSGHKTTGLTPAITQGSIIWGIWENPSKKEGPLHIGTFGNVDQIILPRTQPESNGLLPFSGIIATDRVAGYSLPIVQGKVYESIFYPNMASVSDVTMMQEPPFPLASPSDCEKVPMTSIQKSMQELIQKIERATNQLNSWQDAAQGWISEKQAWIKEQVEKASSFVAQGLKDLFKNIRKFVEEEINKQTKKLIELVNPSDRDKAKVAKDAIIELIVCLFNKMMSNLKGLVGKFLTGMLDRYINVPACAVQNFVGSLLGSTLGALSGAIDSILSKLSALIGGAFSLVNGILGILGQIAGFLACEEDQECPETKEWSIFEGGKPPVSFDIGSIIDQAKGLAANAANLVDIDNIANIDFGDILSDAVNSANKCNIGPLFCGPPQVSFWGGGGSGARGNAIVSAAGDILGIDLISSGLGYTKVPSIDVSDSCGKGGGSRFRVVMKSDGGINPSTLEPTLSVSQVIVEDPGSGYIPNFDGDLGGDGRVWAPKDWTVVRSPDGRWRKYPPEVQNDEIISDGSEDDEIIRSDDRIIFGVFLPVTPTPGTPPGGAAGKPNIDGGIGDIGIGDDIGDKIADRRGITRIPGTGINGETNIDSFPSLDVGSYPIILYLCNIDIEDAGLNYSSTDKIVIKPSNGAEVIPKFGPFGVLESIEILKAGRGYIERPEIYIESETGYNALLNPVLCIDRIGDDLEGLQNPNDLLQSVISVVDCVGNIDNEGFVGFVNGKPYYGPFHIHKSRKMVGASHEQYNGRPHPYIYESASESLRYSDSRFEWINSKLVQTGSTSSTSSTVPLPTYNAPAPPPSPPSSGG